MARNRGSAAGSSISLSAGGAGVGLLALQHEGNLRLAGLGVLRPPPLRLELLAAPLVVDLDRVRRLPLVQDGQAESAQHVGTAESLVLRIV